MVLWNVNSWAAFCVDEGYPTITSILPKKLALFFFLVIDYLRKTLVWRIGERGREIGFPQRETKSILHCWTCMHLSFALGPCPMLSSICSFLSTTFYKLPGLSFTFPTKKRSGQLGPAEVSVMDTT